MINLYFLQVGGQAVLGRQDSLTTPWLTERNGYALRIAFTNEDLPTLGLGIIAIGKFLLSSMFIDLSLQTLSSYKSPTPIPCVDEINIGSPQPNL